MKAITKFIFLLCLTVLNGSVSLAQSETTVVADIKAKYPSYDSYEYSEKKLNYFGFRSYYRHSVYCRYNPKYPCNPGAMIKECNWIEYWSDGSYKNHGIWLMSVVENMPSPDFNKLQAVLTAGDFDPLDALSPSTLWDLLEIHSYELDKTGEIAWRNENEVRVSGKITLTMFNGYLDTRKKIVPATFSFERTDCKQPFTFKSAYFGLGGNGSEETILEEKTHSQEEMKALRLKSIGRLRAEEKAKAEWDKLVEINIPKFEHFHELAFFAKNLFLTGSRDEVKSFLYKTLPSYGFIEGSKYMVTARSQESIDLALKNIFDGTNNFRSQYCSVIQHKQHSVKSYAFYNTDESYHTSLEGELEEGVWKLSDAHIYLSKNPITGDCPTPVEFETLTDTKFGFSILLPKGFKKQISGSAVIYSANVNGTIYTCIANNFGPESSNDERYEQAKSNWKQHSFSGIATYDEVMTDWEMNNVKGRDVRFVGASKTVQNQPRFDEWYRTIYLGDYNFEFYVRGMDYSPENTLFMESFKRL